MAEYKKAIEIDPTHAGALRGLGLDYLIRKEYGNAVPVLQRATELDPKNADGWAYYGQALALQSPNQYPKAIEAAKKALEINPNQATAKQLVGVIEKEMQKQKAAQSGAKP